MNISVVGTSYVGLVSAACFADLGANVLCVDTDARRISTLLYGGIPVYEPGLEALVKRNVDDGRLHFSTNLTDAYEHAPIIFCAVETPPTADGTTDLSQVIALAKSFGAQVTKPSTFIIRSTVPVGTASEVNRIIGEQIAARAVDVQYDVVSNPDFLQEGTAIKDFMSPDRVIMGLSSKRAKAVMSRIYFPLKSNNFPIIYTDNTTAEMIKYASTSMLATRVSFMNEIANLCERVGADVNIVRRGVGTDSRIGSKYIYPGCGYGGTCFPKDIKDLIKIAERHDFSMDVLRAVDDVNTKQKHLLFQKLSRFYGGDLKGKTVALWGLSFKPETDDMREAPSIVTLDQLMDAGCNVRVYDPVAMNECRTRWNSVYCAMDMYDAVNGADALLLLTEWRQFRLPNWERVKANLKTPLVIDGRNIYNPKVMGEMGFNYYCIGL